MKRLLLIMILIASQSHALEFPKTKMARKEAAEHLLNRAAFGPRPGQIEELSQPKKLEAWLEAQLRPKSIDDSAVEAKLKSLPSPAMSGEQLFTNYLTTPDSTRDHMNNRHIIIDLTIRKVVLAAESKRQLEQVLIDFWFNHFSVDRKFPHFTPLYERQAIAPHVFGRFEDLLKASAQHPAMLYYLDNWGSGKVGSTLSTELRAKIQWAYPPPGGRNDNFAREILELHTVGADAGYTEKDIENVAYVFTGWTIAKEQKDPSFVFVPSWHEESDVVVLGRTYEGKAGIDQGLALIRDLAKHPLTAKRVATKLCLRFVADPAPTSCVSRLENSYLDSDGDLTRIYETLFTSTDFWEPKRRLARYKGPFEFVASSLRALGSDVVVDQTFRQALNTALTSSGQLPYSCRVPTGYPEEDSAWNNPASTLWRGLVAPKLIEVAKPKAKLTALDLVRPEFQRR